MTTLTSPRISTFSGDGLYKAYDTSVIQAQQAQRLRVNRVAIVQALRVDHVCPKLTELGVLTEEDLKLIRDSAKTQQEKTRLLIDLLPTKGKKIDWYRGFREALKHPDTRSAEIRRKYQILVDFLDSTLISAPPKKSYVPLVSPTDQKSSQSYPRFEPLPDINDNNAKSTQNLSRVAFAHGSGGNTTSQSRSEGIAEEVDNTQKSQSKDVSESNSKKANKAHVSGYFHREMTMPENFKALVQEPTEHFQNLKNSSNSEERKLLAREEEVLERARAVEVVYALNRRNKLPAGMELCVSNAVDDMLKDTENHHLYLKYFQLLSNRYNLDIIRELIISFKRFVSALCENHDDDDLRKQVVAIGFNLFDFTCQAGLYVKAEDVMLELMNYLATNNSLENWMANWEGLVKLQVISNTNGYFRDADQWHVLATEIGQKMKLMSFGQDLLDESMQFIQVSVTQREQGSISAAYSWAQQALKEVDDDNYEGQIDVLCQAATAYSMQWNVKKAEQLLVQAVRIAKKHFGEYSPQHLRALIQLVLFCNEFRVEEVSVSIARRVVEIAEVMYHGATSLVRAQAHEALARALVAARCQGNELEECIQAARSAHRISMDILPSLHPKTASFRMTNAYVLLCRAGQTENEEEENAHLMEAEEEAKAAAQIFQNFWGDYSLKLAQARSLLAQIYMQMEKIELAEEMLQDAANIYAMSVSPKNNYQCLILATVGTFFRLTGRPLDAIDHLVDCVNKLASTGIYLRWADVAFSSLISAFRATGKLEEASSYELQQADWRKKNPRPTSSLAWETLHENPGEFESWRAEFFTLASKLSKSKRGLKNFIKAQTKQD